MITARLRSLQQYQEHKKVNAHIYRKIQEVEDGLFNKYKGTFTVKGFSYPAQKEVDFLVDYQYSDGVHINWRERVVCPITHLNNRLRASIHFMDFELDLRRDTRIYIAEQLTPLYSYLKKKYPQVIGSEYLGPAFTSGQVNDQGLRHEDNTNMSFKDNELDCYMTFDCLEHIPDFAAAFRESYRVLKPGGTLYWSVPFSINSQENIIRATVNADGTINHILPPDLHGDPVNPEGGILCFQYFGWELFDMLKEIGFSDAYAITYWSDSLGYYGTDQLLFCAIK
jgi:SAM-dependent methyltransferase